MTYSLLLSLLLLPCFFVHSQAKVDIVMDAANVRWEISEMLTGSHFVYAFERDTLYQDDRIADWMKSAKVGLIRWPGGTAVQHYHWDSLNGIAFKEDSWDPYYNKTSKAETNFMDLDEFMAYCRRVGSEPMVGVNILSGMKYDKDTEGINEATRLIKYCVSSGYHVKYWYIGNEGYASGFGAKKYADYIDKYAKALKSVDPSITIIADWKLGPIGKKRFLESMEIVKRSKYIDIMEYHEKWGVEWGLSSGKNIDEWRNQFPIYNGKLGEYIDRFHELTASIGKSNVQIAFNEWGLGSIEGADPYDHALVAADYLMELFTHKVSQACYWNLNMGNGFSRILNTSNDRKVLKGLRPVAKVFEIFSSAQGQQLLFIESTDKRVYGFASKDEHQKITLYLLNKSDEEQDINLVSNLTGSESVSIESFSNPGKIVKRDTEVNDIKLVPWSLTKIIL